MIVQYLVATACLLFVLSLPLGKLPFAGLLRRWAGFLFLVAFLPSLCFGLITTAQHQHGPSATPPRTGFSFGAVVGFIILSVIAYAILEVRKRLRPGKSADAWSDYVSLRTAGKRPVGGDRPARTASLFEDPDDR
jgi:O-antigen ligase